MSNRPATLIPLDYAAPAIVAARTGLAVICGLTAVALAAMAAWCVAHAAQVTYAHQHSPGPFFCVQCADEWEAGLGLPVERTVPLGLVGGGVAFAAAVQSARLYNRSRDRRRAPHGSDRGGPPVTPPSGPTPPPECPIRTAAPAVTSPPSWP